MKKANKLISLLLAILIAFTLFIPSLASDEKEIKLVVLGDSIAQGYGLKNIKETAYGALISEANGYDYVNHAIGGHTTYNLNKRLQEPEVIEDVEDADIIAVSIGGNNFLLGGMYEMMADAIFKGDYSKMDATGADFKENFIVAIERIKELNPDATLMIQTLYNPRNDYLKEPYQYAIDIINTTYADALSSNPEAYVIVDVAAAFAEHGEYIQKDKIHPNELGHYVIAREYIEVLYESGLGTAQEPISEMPEIEEESGSLFMGFFAKILDFFKNIVETIRAFFRGIGDMS